MRLHMGRPGAHPLRRHPVYDALDFARIAELRTTVGRDEMTDALFGNSGSRPTVAQIIALSETATAPAAAHQSIGSNTTSGGNELAADGFSRATATYAHTAGTQTSTLQKSFTHTGPAGGGTARTIRVVALFAQAFGGTIPGAADSGILVFEMSEPNAPTLTGTDSLNQTISIDMGT